MTGVQTCALPIWPGDLPVEQAERFVSAINRGTAKALGITIPQSILLRADEVIQ